MRRYIPRRLLVLLLLAAIGLGAYLAGRQLWAGYHLRKAQEALSRHDFTGAQAHLAICLSVWPQDNGTCLLAARTARRGRQYDEAERLLARYRKIGGVPEAITMEHALARAQRGEMAGIEMGLWEGARQATPEAPLIWEALAQGYMGTFRWPKAVYCLTMLLELEPDNADAYVWRGWGRQNLSHLPGAIDDFRRAIELDPTNDEARLSLAELVLQSSLPQESLEHFWVLYERDQARVEVVVGLAQCLRLVDQLDQAREVLDAFLIEHPTETRALAERGRLAMAQGQAGEAEPWLRQAVAQDPHDRQSRYDFCLCLQRLGKDEEAQESRKILKAIDEDAERYQQLIAAMETRPNDLAVPCAIAEILLRNGQDKQAVGWLNGVLRQNEHYQKAHQLLSDHYRRAGNLRLAEYHQKQMANPATGGR
jgi:tetratricopeptide (TPR) repeat protein